MFSLQILHLHAKLVLSLFSLRRGDYLWCKALAEWGKTWSKICISPQMVTRCLTSEERGGLRFFYFRFEHFNWPQSPDWNYSRTLTLWRLRCVPGGCRLISFFTTLDNVADVYLWTIPVTIALLIYLYSLQSVNSNLRNSEISRCVV